MDVLADKSINVMGTEYLIEPVYSFFEDQVDLKGYNIYDSQVKVGFIKSIAPLNDYVLQSRIFDLVQRVYAMKKDAVQDADGQEIVKGDKVRVLEEMEIEHDVTGEPGIPPTIEDVYKVGEVLFVADEYPGAIDIGRDPGKGGLIIGKSLVPRLLKKEVA